MKKRIPLRVYKFTDADLKQKADDIANSVEKDIDLFIGRGVTLNSLQVFRDIIEDFAIYPTDIEFMANQISATDQKNAIVDQLITELSRIRNMAEIKYNGSGLLSVFRIGDITHMPDLKLIKLAQKAHRVGTTLIADLASEGLTTTLLDNLMVTATALDTALQNQDIAEEGRDFATYYRTLKGNAVFNEMSRLCSIGKSLWYNVNESSYNNYVLTEEK